MAMVKYMLACALVALFIIEIQCFCTHNGIKYKKGESYQDDCNQCVCGKAGGGCTRKACPPKPCREGKNRYGAGEQFMAKDGCNICTCRESGVSTCTRKAC